MPSTLTKTHQQEKINEDAATFLSLYSRERKIKQLNISFIFCGWVGGGCGEESAGTAGALRGFVSANFLTSLFFFYVMSSSFLTNVMYTNVIFL